MFSYIRPRAIEVIHFVEVVSRGTRKGFSVNSCVRVYVLGFNKFNQCAVESKKKQSSWITSNRIISEKKIFVYLSNGTAFLSLR